MRRVAAAIGLLALVGFIAWACTDGDHDGVAPLAQAAVAETVPTVSGTGTPGPSGAALTVTAPEPVIQSCAIEVTAMIQPPDPGNPPLSATLTVSHGVAGIIFTGSATMLDPGTGAATWSLDRPVTESWPAGAILVQATVSRASGEILEAEVGSEVVEMNTLVVQIGDATFKNGDTLALPCDTVTPAPLQPSYPNGGYTFPAGPFVPCGPVTSGATILAPNMNAAGQTVLSISSSPATVFGITLENHGEAEVQFTSPSVRGAVTVIRISHRAPLAEAKVQVFLEGIIFDHEFSREIEDGSPLRRNGEQRPDGDFPDDFAQPAWTEHNEDRGVNDYDLYPKSVESKRPTFVPRGTLFNDSVALYKRNSGGSPGKASQRTIKALFRIKHEDPSFGPGGVNAGARYFQLRIGFGSNMPAGQEFAKRITEVAPPIQETVWFDIRSGENIPGHESHLHSLSPPTVPAVGNIEPRDPAGNPLPVAQPGFPPHTYQSGPQKGQLILSAPKPGRAASTMDHLHLHYITFTMELADGRLDRFRFFDEKLKWRFLNPYTREWEDVKMEIRGADPSVVPAISMHRFYVLADDALAPWRTGTRVTDVHLPWFHLLDEILSSPPTSPDSPDPFGAVGGIGTAGYTTDVAKAITVYLSSHDRPAWHPRGSRLTYDGNAPNEAKGPMRAESFNTQDMRQVQASTRPIRLDLSRVFLAILCKRPAGETARMEFSCFELSAVHAFLSRLCSVDPKIHILASKTMGNITKRLAVWGQRTGPGGSRLVLQEFGVQSGGSPTNHAYGVLSNGRELTVYDTLYSVMQPPPSDVIAGEHHLRYHVDFMGWHTLITVILGKQLNQELFPNLTPDELRDTQRFINEKTLQTDWEIDLVEKETKR